MKAHYVAIEYRTVTRISPLSGRTHSMTIGAPPEHWAAWKKGELIQRAFPELSDDQREFLLSGIAPVEWESLKEDE